MRGVFVRRIVVLVCACVILAVNLSAQAPTLPPIDAATKELIGALYATDQAHAAAVQARIDAMLKTDEGKAYQAELGKRQANQKEINKRIAEKVPGFQIDFSTGKLVPIEKK